MADLSVIQPQGAEPLATELYCHACGSSRLLPADEVIDLNWMTTRNRYRIHVCESCGSGLTVGAGLGVDQLGSYYPPAYGAFDDFQGGLVAIGWKGLHSLEIVFTSSLSYASHVDPFFVSIPADVKSILEIGCGSGHFLGAVSADSRRVVGVEPHREGVLNARERGLDVREGRIEDVDLGGEIFDRVYAIHVLEHVRDPEAMLLKCHSALSDSGKVIIAVPNFDCPLKGFFGAARYSLDIPRHLHHFTPRGIEALLRKTGFRLERTEFENGIEELVLSFRNMVRSARPLTGRTPMGASGIDVGWYAASIIFRSVAASLGVCYGRLLQLTGHGVRRYMVVVACKA